jgi:nucleoside-diphosphate-sugar epimerase
MKKRLLITGSSGFIGQNAGEYWKNDYEIVPVSFSKTDPELIPVMPGDIILHLAGIAHQEKNTGPELYYEVNFRKAVSLAKTAKEKGAAHFIFVSTTKVFGKNAGIISEDEPCLPVDDYGKSKLMAEEAIAGLQDDSFVVSVLRPPLVYGAGVKGNMLKLLKWTSSGKPLIFKGIHNKRTVVSVGNLLAMAGAIIENKAPGIFIPADDEPLSTFEMLSLMKQSFGTQNRELAMPEIAVKFFAAIFPVKAAKIFGSLLYNNKTSFSRLGFKNPYSTEKSFRDMAEWYTKSNNK